jgi:peptidoglycan/xylan/chitin deacetylase (PgdA/CDA1 family)
MDIARNLYHRAVLLPGVDSWFKFARRDAATVLMCHRFSDPDRGIDGLDPAHLRRGLEYLRKHKYDLLSLEELCARLKDARVPLGGGVAFTIDDGYIDHAAVAAPVFAEFDCPVTTFVTTGFIDGLLWMWWDQIEYICRGTTRALLDLELDGVRVKYSCDHRDVRAAICKDLVQRCKRLRNDDKLALICRLGEVADVEVPRKPPKAYSPMSWDDARRCETKGMTFGPHTVTHPILSRLCSKDAVWEITESWRRLSEEVTHPLPVFCYPNGEWSDFGPAEMDVLRASGFWGAVVGQPGFADRASFACDPDGPFKIRRLPFPDRVSDLAQYVCGIERFKQRVRGRP